MKILGELQTKFYQLTVTVDDPPPQCNGMESRWLYITKRHPDGRIERNSIGIGMSNIDGLLRILQKASDEYEGKRAEFREKGVEYEQRTMSCE